MVARANDLPAVLVLDDEPDIAASLRQLLEMELSARVLAEVRPSSALLTLDSEPVPVVITDYNMPEMNGLRFLERAQRICPGFRAIIMTGVRSFDAHESDLARLGVRRIFHKPFDYDQFVAVVRSLLAEAGVKPGARAAGGL